MPNDAGPKGTNQGANGDGQGEARPAESSDGGRRQFLKIGVGVLGTGVAAAVVAPAVPYVLFPLDHEVTKGGGEFVVVGDRSQFSPQPTKVDIFAEKFDAWNRIERVKLGSAWVADRDGELVAFSTVCPHLGCAIDFDADAGKFKCPCHRSAFALDGAREEGPAPRGLDTLQIKDEDGAVAVLYERFKQGTEDKERV